MAKNLSAPEAVAIAGLAASGGPHELVSLVESQLFEDPAATEALEAAKGNPRDGDKVSHLAGYIRKYGRGKNFRTQVRSILGSRNSVAAIGVAGLVTTLPPEQRPRRLVRLVNSRIGDDPEARERLEAAAENPDNTDAVSELASRLRPHFQRLRSLPDIPIRSAPVDISPKRLEGTLPEFRRAVRAEAKGFTLDPKAQQIVGDLLRRASEEIRSAPEDRREELIAATKVNLSRGVQTAVEELRQHADGEDGVIVVDAPTLATAIRASGPLWPFCEAPAPVAA